MRISSGYGPRPAGGGFETFSWYFFRISGIALVFLALIHLFVNHVSTDVSCTSYQLVRDSLFQPFLARLRLAALDSGSAAWNERAAHRDR